MPWREEEVGETKHRGNNWEKRNDWNRVYFATFGATHVLQPPRHTQSQWVTMGRRPLEVPPLLIYYLTQHFAAGRRINVTLNNAGCSI